MKLLQFISHSIKESGSFKWLVDTFHNPFTAWLILFISTCLTFIGWRISTNYYEELGKSRFEFKSNEIVNNIKERMIEYEQVLRGGVALINTKEDITRKDWNVYVSSLQVEKYWPGIQGIGYSVQVTPSALNEHQQTLRSTGFPDYSIYPNGDRDYYTSIIYLEPFDWRNKRAFGYDMWSNETRKIAMERARDTGEAATSGIITLVQETEIDVQKGFLMYLPVYEHNKPLTTVEERKSAFKGWVYSPFRANDLMNGILTSSENYYHFEIYDGSKYSEQSLLFDSDFGKSHIPIDDSDDLSTAIPILMQGQPWLVLVNAENENISDAILPKLVAIGGIIIDLLLFYVILALAGLNARARALAENMTEKVHKDESLLRTVIDNVPLHIIVKNRENEVTLVNRVASQLLFDERTKEFYSLVISEQDGKLKYFNKDLDDRAIQGEVITHKEIVSEYLTGEKLIFDISKFPLLDAKGEVESLLTIAEDITDKKIADEILKNEHIRLKAFIEHNPAAVAMFDTHMNYLAVSEAWKILYHTDSDELVGKHHYEINPNIPERWKEQHQSALKGEVISVEEDEYIPMGETNRIFLDRKIRPWYYGAHEIGGILVLSQNVTDRVLQREELKNAKKMAETANSAKSEFLANMSHEIRTPLNSVIGFTDLMKSTELDETQNVYIENINSSAKILLNLINDILDFSKIEAGKLELTEEKADLWKLCENIINLVSYKTNEKGIDLHLHIAHDIPQFVVTDQIRLTQVLINLIGNAVKFTEKGQVTLIVTKVKDCENGVCELLFEVIDTGIGINRIQQNKIFEAFSQEDATTTRKFGGTGLGLSISNKILNLMGSKLELESKLGKGSTFYFNLKLKEEAGNELDCLPEIEGLDSIKKVLVVDDNETSSATILEILKKRNIPTEVVNNGLDALTYFSGNKVDIAFIDYKMPFIDGIEVIKKLRNEIGIKRRDTKIILMHNLQNDEILRNEMNALQISEVVKKPFSIQKLYSLLIQIYLHEESLNKNLQLETESGKHILDRPILVVDDNPINLFLIRSMIKKIIPGVSIVEAENGIDAVRLYEELNPSIVFMDIQMPGISGYEATQQIRQKEIGTGTHTPIIAVTAGAIKGEEERCLNAGMDEYIVKPVVQDRIERTLLKWLITN
ncbi:response regulator [bacterium]|nr:MAG: response regulator [bacterium]